MAEPITSQENVPEPEDPGVVPEQRQATAADATALVHVRAPGGLSSFAVSDALKDIPGGVRSQAGMVLLAASARLLESEIDSLRRESQAARQAADDWQAKFHAESQARAILEERVSHLVSAQKVMQLVGALGGLVEGVALPIAVASPTVLSIAGCALGAILLLASWLPRKMRGTP